MVEKTEKLIGIVKSYPILYNSSHEHFNNIKLKTRLWQIIAETINERDGEVLKARWENLKDRYVRHLETTKKGLGAQNMRDGREDELYNNNWPWEKQMSFLREHLEESVQYNVTNKVNNNYIEEPVVPSAQVETPVQRKDSLAQQANFQRTEAGTAQTQYPQQVYQITTQQPCDRNVASNRETALSNQQVLHNQRRNRESQVEKVIEYLNKRDKKEYDETDLIFFGYSKTIKKMSLQRQASVKFSIAKIIMEAELNHAEDMASTRTTEIVNIKQEPYSIDVDNVSNNNYENTTQTGCFVEMSDFPNTEIKTEVVTDPLLVNNYASEKSITLPNVVAESVSLFYRQSHATNPNENTEPPNKKVKKT